jgi:phosphatidylglycerophosphate synthase
LVNHYYAHRVDPVLTWAADRVGFSPNGATLLSLLAGLGAALTIGCGQYVAAAVLLQLHHLTDGVDGNLARYHKRCTEFGRRFDILSDQLVRLALVLSLALVADVPSWVAGAMIATVYIDLALVHWVVVPFSKRRPLVHSRWKRWFMERGLLPAFDIFTIYLVVSMCLLLGSPEAAVVLVATMKTLDWGYRLYEVALTARLDRRQATD